MKTKVMQNFGWQTRCQLWEMCKWIYPALVIAVAKVSQLNILHAKQLSGLSRNKSPFEPHCGREESVELLNRQPLAANLVRFNKHRGSKTVIVFFKDKDEKSLLVPRK